MPRDRRCAGQPLGRESAQTPHPILGVPLLERVLLGARKAGATRFFVVTRDAGDQVSTFLHDPRERRALDLTVLTLDLQDRDNAWSVLRARSHLNEPSLLLICDHLLDPAMLEDLIRHGLDGSDLVLAVDTRIERESDETGEATTVLVEDALIRSIGKGLHSFNEYDMGAFLCFPAVFETLEQAATHGETCLSAGMDERPDSGSAPSSLSSWRRVQGPQSGSSVRRVMIRASTSGGIWCGQPAGRANASARPARPVRHGA